MLCSNCLRHISNDLMPNLLIARTGVGQFQIRQGVERISVNSRNWSRQVSLPCNRLSTSKNRNGARRVQAEIDCTPGKNTRLRSQRYRPGSTFEMWTLRPCTAKPVRKYTRCSECCFATKRYNVSASNVLVSISHWETSWLECSARVSLNRALKLRLEASSKD
jgi:hypothetical protein